MSQTNAIYDEEDNEQNLEEIIKSFDTIKLYFKADANECLTKQSCTCKCLRQFYVDEEKRSKKCELVVEFNKRYILETNIEKKNRLKQLINTTTQSVKTDLLEMIEDTECPEGLYLLYCELAKEKHNLIDKVLTLTKLADELTEL